MTARGEKSFGAGHFREPVCLTFKLDRKRYGKLHDAVFKHDLSTTYLLIFHIDQIIPVLQKAQPVVAPGYSNDCRRAKSGFASGRGHRKQGAASYSC